MMVVVQATRATQMGVLIRAKSLQFGPNVNNTNLGKVARQQFGQQFGTSFPSSGSREQIPAQNNVFAQLIVSPKIKRCEVRDLNPAFLKLTKNKERI